MQDIINQLDLADTAFTNLKYPKVMEKNNDNSDQKFNIFVVEDSDIYRELLRSFVKTIDRNYVNEDNSRYQVHSFSSGEACLAGLDKKPDIILLDYYLDGYMNNESNLNGLETLKEIKKQSPETHVIIVSTQPDYTLRAEFIKNGASDYISKEPGVRDKIQGSVYKLIKIIEQSRREATV